MSNIELINLHHMIFTIILPITSYAFAFFKVIAPKAFTKHKNLVLKTPRLSIDSHVTTSNTQTI